MVVMMLTLLVALSFVANVFSEPNPSYVCSFCAMTLGLVEQAAFQIQLQEYLTAKCNSVTICEYAVKKFIFQLETKVAPDAMCKDIGLCPDQCTLYTQWPVTLPPQPIPWDVERKLSDIEENDFTDAKLSLLKPIFMEFVADLPSTRSDENGIPMLGHTVFAMAKFAKEVKAFNDRKNKLQDYEPCGFNLTCHIEDVIDHISIQDHDGDRYAVPEFVKLRGSDWRGSDCNDMSGDIYPGRSVNSDETGELDHNCNGISGSNATGTYEDMFCSGDYAPRGLVLLGDSATAHFHIPPQWVTAQGWNLDGLLDVALDELDFPHCSWGTAHTTLENCPYQYPVPGVDGIISLYTQMKDRNRCNNNDFQNIGVNGARMTSSMGLVDALARQQALDSPVLLWLSLIGNDVCNGHPNFDHMTPPDEFYEKAMETLNALDKLLPSGSHVVALALFDGELLYDTMHNKQHPVGASYNDVYEFMNCLEENPCWGWLNANQTVRQITTAHSDALNMVYRNISETASFENFEFIFYSPVWMSFFSDYSASGEPVTNLIEPTDGFHPSQTGNALFAKEFFSFLESNHPEALGAINPFNSEIDSLFFKV